MNLPALKTASDWCIKHNIIIPDDIVAGLYSFGIDVKTPGYYARVMWEAVRELYAGDIEAYDFEEVMLRLISEQLRKAWNAGMVELNLDPQTDQTEEGEAALQEIMSSELDYVGQLAEDIIAAAEAGQSVKGGEGSGNFGHEGRPGEVGGSGPGGGGGDTPSQASGGDYTPRITDYANPSEGQRPATNEQKARIEERIKSMPEAIRNLEPIDDKYRTTQKLSGETIVIEDKLNVGVIVDHNKSSEGTAFASPKGMFITEEFIGTGIQDHEYIHTLTHRNFELRDAIQNEYNPPYLYQHAEYSQNQRGEQFTMTLSAYSEDREEWVSNVADINVIEGVDNSRNGADAQMAAVEKILGRFAP